jgi:hypothetical protein
MGTPESPNQTSAAGTQARPASDRIGLANAGVLQPGASLPALYSEMLAVATCFVFGGWLGLPAAMRILRLGQQGRSTHPDAAANDDRFEA